MKKTIALALAALMLLALLTACAAKPAETEPAELEQTVQTEQLRTDLVYRVRLTVNDPKGQLRQGQPVTVIVPTGRN